MSGQPADDRRGRRWRCEKCGQSGILFDGCGLSECEAVTVPRDEPEPQPARIGGEEA